MRTLAGRVAAQFLAILLTVAVFAGLPSPAWTQQLQGSGASELLGFFVRGVDSAYDPTTRSYFVVGGAGTLLGICINEQGTPISGPITINSDGFGSFPRVKYGGGGFLVVWPEEVGGVAQLRSRRVNCSGQVGPEQTISGGATAFTEVGAALEYSPYSFRFLVAWQSFHTATSPTRVKATLVDLNGTQFGPIVDLSSGYARNPGVTWNYTNDSFGVSFSGETGSSAFSSLALVPASNPAAFGRTDFNAIPGGQTSITDVAFNPYTGLYVMAWFEIAGGLYARVAELDPSGNLVASGIASGRLGSYDALSLAFNPVTGTFALIGIDRNDNLVGLELNGRGYPFNGENTLSVVPRARPARYPRVTASTTSPTYNSTFSLGFGSIASVMVTSYSSSGGPGGSFAAPPPTPGPSPAPTPSTCPGSPPVAGWVCVNGGWLPPDHPLAGGVPAPAPAPAPVPAPTPSTCPGAVPVAGWVCVSGSWLPPDHPLAGRNPAPVPAPAPAPAPVPAPSTCLGSPPVAGWLCVNTGWLPPDHPLAAGASPAPVSSPSSCTTAPPSPTWFCVGGGWVPPNYPSAPGNACAGSAPAPGWVCTANGGWVPPNHPLAGGSGH